jgi:holin-like protein
MPFVRSVCFLLFCQLVGEIVSRAFDLVLPGPVLGAGLCLGLMFVMMKRPEGSAIRNLAVAVRETCHRLLGILGLLFVPAGVGVIQYLHFFADYGSELVIVLVVSTTSAMVVTVLTYLAVSRALNRTLNRPHEGKGGPA